MHDFLSAKEAKGFDDKVFKGLVNLGKLVKFNKIVNDPNSDR
jgi:hypothetical protein